MNIHVYMIGYDVLSSCFRDKTDENKLNMWIFSMFGYRYHWKRGLWEHPKGACGHVTVLESSKWVVIKKGASKTVEVLVAETNHVERLHGLEVWNGPETLSVMTKRDWSNIHGEVKEAESWKAIAVVWVPGWNKTKREKKTLATLSCPF